jgi:hypothetical protein
LRTGLEIYGERVDADFENWIRPQIERANYARSKEQLILRHCLEFKKEKKKCGVSTDPMGVEAVGLAAGHSIGFEEGYTEIPRQVCTSVYSIHLLIFRILGDELRNSWTR